MFFFFKGKEYTKKQVFQRKPQDLRMHSEFTYHRENATRYEDISPVSQTLMRAFMNYFAYCNTAHKLLKYVILRRNTVSYLYLVLRVITSNTGHYLVLQKTCFCLALRKRFPTRHNNEMVQKHHPHCCTRNQITLIITSRFEEGDLAPAL